MNDDKVPKQDFLKYWRIVRYYVKEKYKLSTPDLEMLLFLYSERYFKKGDFTEYEQIMSWDRYRWDRLRREGWIIKFRPHKRSTGEGAVYCLSHYAKGIIKGVYQKLLGGDTFSVDVKRNPMGKQDTKYMNKVYRNYMKKINEEYKAMKRNNANL